MRYVQDFLENSKNIGKINDKTYRSYEKDLDDFGSFLSAKGIDIDANDKIIKEYADELSNKYGSKSIYRKVSSIRNFYRYLIRNQIISKMPSFDITIKNTEMNDKKRLTSEEYIALLSICKDDYEGQRDGILIKLMYETSFGIEDIIKLRNEDLRKYNYTALLMMKKGKVYSKKLTKELSNEIKGFATEYELDNLFLGTSEYRFKCKLIEYGNDIGLDFKLTPKLIKNMREAKTEETTDTSSPEFFKKMKDEYMKIGIGDEKE